MLTWPLLHWAGIDSSCSDRSSSWAAVDTSAADKSFDLDFVAVVVDTSWDGKAVAVDKVNGGPVAAILI